MAFSPCFLNKGPSIFVLQGILQIMEPALITGGTLKNKFPRLYISDLWNHNLETEDTSIYTLKIFNVK